jgi:hypothetical protein
MPNPHTAEIFSYRVSSNRVEAQCTIEIYRGKSDLIIVSELPNNPGMSICNAFEELFLQVVKAYDLRPEKLLWIEHWEAWKVTDGAPYDREEEEWSKVIFDWDGRRASNPRWQYVSQTFVEAAKSLL